MRSKLEKLSMYLYAKGLSAEVDMVNFLTKYAELKENSSDEDELSILDLVGSNNETVAGQHYNKPQHVISYSEDAEPGVSFTDDDEDFSKKAHGLLDVPYGSPDGNVSHRRRDKYEQQDKEVAESFFGAESNIDSEESYPPANIDRCNNKPINILDQTEFEDFFSFLHSNDGKLNKEKI